MRKGWKGRFDLALSQDRFDDAEEVLEKACREGADRQSLNEEFGRLATELKAQDMLERAIDALRRAIELGGDRGLRLVLEQWLKELNEEEAWSASRRDCHRTSYQPSDAATGLLHFKPLWAHTFRSALQREGLLDIPSPILARGMIVSVKDSLKSFIGLATSDRSIKWKSGLVARKLGYASSPVYIRPYLFFATKNRIRRVSMRELSKPEIVFDGSAVKLVPYSAPLAFQRKAIFAFEKHVFLYDTKEDRYSLFEVDLGGDQDRLRSPVVCNDEVYFVSARGKMFRLSPATVDGELQSLDQLSSGQESVCSPACAFEESIYFESVDPNGSRNVCCYTPRDDRGLLTDVGEDFCSPEHSHLDFAP